METKIKSPTSKLGFIDPEGILKGSAMNDLINRAMNTAKETDFKLLKKLFCFFVFIIVK